MRRQMNLRAIVEALPSNTLLQQRLIANPIWLCLRHPRSLVNKSREKRTLKRLRCITGPKSIRGIPTRSTKY